MAALAVALLLAGCAGGERLSASMASINREYGELQNEALLLNILRRSASMPAHFTSLGIIRGRSRITAGADLSIPFGGQAPAQFDFNPNLSIVQGPAFEVLTQANQEFYRGYVAPIGTTAINYYLLQDFPKALVLSLFIDRIHIQTPNRDIQVVNSPSQPDEYAAFQRVLQRLVDQGLTMENIVLVDKVGSPMQLDQPPSFDQLLSAHQESLIIQQTGTRHYQLMKVSEAVRFCFSEPRAPLFEQARCSSGLNQRFAVNDPRLFGSTRGARILFESGELGSIEMYTRSLAGMMNYLGDIVRVQQASKEPLMVPTRTGPQPILVVLAEPRLGPAAVTTEFAGNHYSIPAGPEGGLSGSVLTVLSQLMAQAQSVENLPVSDTVTIIGS